METQFFRDEIFNEMKESQDNSCLSDRDRYGQFLIGLLNDNSGYNHIVDMDQLEMDLGYAIDQFSRALRAIKAYREEFQQA